MEIDNELKCCKFCSASLEKVIDTKAKALYCNNCNVRFYGTHMYRIIFSLNDELYWFTCSTFLNKTCLYKKIKSRFKSMKLGEWNEILAITPSNAEKKLKTILVFM